MSTAPTAARPGSAPHALAVLDEVTWYGQPVQGRQPRGLLRALVAAGPRGLSQEALIDAIWADHGEPLPASPERALQVVVSRTRAATSAEAVERTPLGYRLALATLDVDAWALRPEGLRLAAAGRYADALALLERAEPDDEVLVALLRAEAAVRGVPTALARYGAYRESLADRLGIDPSLELQALHREGLLARDQPVRRGVRFDTEPLVGRDTDVVALQTLVRGHRLTSIVGAGGLGKTRLARLIARTAEQPVVYFVELAGVTSGEGVAVEVADALGLRDTTVGAPLAQRRADLLARIVDAVSTVPTLLVLDNCEHVQAAVARLVSALLAATPALRVLTTTRAPLGLTAEQVYLLPELSLDDGVTLFVRRATAARQTVALEVREVRELVARLDGLPLAIELAAAKVRAMSVAEIAQRLDNRFELLRGGSPDAPERHQTLLAVIDWSWNLLGEPEQTALRRLAVFQDGFALAGATAVIGRDALDPIETLVDQSLLVVRERHGLRYRMLETVREFALLQLAAAGEEDATGQQLRAWAMALAMTGFDRLYSRDQVAMMQRIRQEQGNLVDVLRRSLRQHDLPGVVVVFAALAEFWTIEGAHLKVHSVAPEVEELLLGQPTPDALSEPVSAALVVLLANSMVFGSRLTRPARRRLRELQPAVRNRRIAQSVRVVLAASPRGIAASVEDLQSLVDDPDPLAARLARTWIALGYENEGDLVTARMMAANALGLCDDEDGPWMRSLLTEQIGSFAFQSGDFAAAQSYFTAALPLLRELGADEDRVRVQASLGLLAVHTGQFDEATRRFDEVAREDNAHLLFGGGLLLGCGRAELLLAHGQAAAGLAAYAATVESVRTLALPGLRPPTERAGTASSTLSAGGNAEPLSTAGTEAWRLLPTAALVAASVRHGDRAQLERDALLRDVTRVLGDADFVDVPILGCVLFALGVWELVYGGRDVGAQLLAFAHRFAFSRMLPSFDWIWATSLGQPADIGNAKPAELRGTVHALLVRLDSR